MDHVNERLRSSREHLSRHSQPPKREGARFVVDLAAIYRLVKRLLRIRR